MSRGDRRPRPQALLDAIDAEAPGSFGGSVWRVVTEGRDPLQPGRAGGRWDDGSFDVLYTSSARDGALAETWFHITRGQPIPPSKPLKRIFRIEVTLERVLDLSGEGRLAALGVDMRSFGRLSYLRREGEYPTTQQIGEVAYFFGFEAMIVPNARWPASNVVIMTENARLARMSADEGERVDLSRWHAEARGRT